MIIYNVTYKVDHSIAADWLRWLKEEYIPEIIGTSCFTHAIVLHIVEADDEEGITYAIQYHTDNKERYNKYIDNFADDLRKKSIDKWGNKFIAFSTLMQVVN